MKLASQAPSLLVLQAQKAAGELVQRGRRRFAFGDITVDCIYRDPRARHRDGDMHDRNVYTSAILAPANALRIHTLAVRYTIRISLELVSRLVRYNQFAETTV